MTKTIWIKWMNPMMKSMELWKCKVSRLERKYSHSTCPKDEMQIKNLWMRQRNQKKVSNNVKWSLMNRTNLKAMQSLNKSKFKAKFILVEQRFT